MPIQTVTQKNTLVSAYTGAATHGALYSTPPGATAGTELTGGAPAYARKALSWGAPSNGVAATTATPFDVASGTTVRGAGVHAGAAGAYLDGVTLTDQAFASQGTFSVTFQYTQS